MTLKILPTSSSKPAPEDSAAVEKVILLSVTNGCVDEVKGYQVAKKPAKPMLKQRFGNRLLSLPPLMLADEVASMYVHSRINCIIVLSFNCVSLKIMHVL